MVDWLEINSEIKIITSVRTNVLLPYYGRNDYEFYNIAQSGNFTFKSGRKLKFIEAPFLHFPGAFATLDETSGFLFSGDVFAALDINWKLVVDDFQSHANFMDLFHLDYMPSNIATSGFAKRIEKEELEAILPQHGSIINKEHISDAVDYLKNLKCGLDIIYAANE
jgi:flavorubredoxin